MELGRPGVAGWYRRRVPYSAFLRRRSATDHLRCDPSEALPGSLSEESNDLAACQRGCHVALVAPPVFIRVSSRRTAILSHLVLYGSLHFPGALAAGSLFPSRQTK